MSPEPSRREWLAGAAAAVAVPAAGLAPGLAAEPTPNQPFGYCFNTSTIRGQKVPVAEEIDLVAKAGYQAIEPWVNELEAHVKAGGSLKDLAKRAADRGLTVEDAIGFLPWVVDDEGQRKKALEDAKRVMG